MTSTLVSVVIPTYNYGHFVCEAVESALAQTYPAVEVIVVDDGSKDDTRERLAVYCDRIRYIYQENQGLSAARNTGIREARGDYIAFLDSDDAFHPRKLAIQMGVFASDPTLATVATAAFSCDRPVWETIPDGHVTTRRITLDEIVLTTRFGPSSVITKKACFQSVGDFDTSLRSVEDRDMWIRLAARYPIARVELPLMWYRVSPGSMSRNAERMEQFERVVLDKAFQMPELAGRWRLKRKADSLAAFAAALMYREAGMHRPALGRDVRSLWLWPFPLTGGSLRPFTRLKFLALLPRFYLGIRAKAV
jgi:glycosyltransferase involved in cell wall biosynthesis